MAHRDLLGRIDCPYCGMVQGAKITEDKSGNPFGNCDLGCYGQLRIGDKSGYRKSAFYKRYPGVKKAGGNPVTVTGGKIPVTVTEEKQEAVHGTAAATTEPGGVQVPVPVTAKLKAKTYAESLAELLGHKS